MGNREDEIRKSVERLDRQVKASPEWRNTLEAQELATSVDRDRRGKR